MTTKLWRAWPPEEVVLLRQVWGSSVPLKTLMHLFPGRSIDAIKGKAGKEGLPPPSERLPRSLCRVEQRQASSHRTREAARRPSRPCDSRRRITSRGLRGAQALEGKPPNPHLWLGQETAWRSCCRLCMGRGRRCCAPSARGPRDRKASVPDASTTARQRQSLQNPDRPGDVMKVSPIREYLAAHPDGATAKQIALDLKREETSVMGSLSWLEGTGVAKPDPKTKHKTKAVWKLTGKKVPNEKKAPLKVRGSAAPVSFGGAENLAAMQLMCAARLVCGRTPTWVQEPEVEVAP